VKELVDDIFRMGTAYLIRSGERIPPAEMAYFECLNEINVSECIVPPRPEMDQLLGPFDGVPDGHRASRPRTSLEDVVHSDAIQEAEQQTEELGSAEPQESKSDPDTKLASPAVARYITEDQLGTMGWKDLFKLARVSDHLIQTPSSIRSNDNTSGSESRARAYDEEQTGTGEEVCRKVWSRNTYL
jgi:hypothetical protein